MHASQPHLWHNCWNRKLPCGSANGILDSFLTMMRKGKAAHCTYRTKDTILEIYDAFAEAMRTGQPYQTCFGPPSADPCCCYPAKECER